MEFPGEKVCRTEVIGVLSGERKGKHSSQIEGKDLYQKWFQ